MKSAVESLEPTKVKLTVEVEADDFKPALERAYKEIQGQIRVPGFRPGKVPARIVDQRVGRGVVLEQAIGDSLNDWYRKAFEEHELRPMAQGEIDISRQPDPLAAEPDFEFTATVEIRPEVVLPDLANVKVVVKPAEVTDQTVDEMLDELRGRFASLKTVDRPAGDGDYVTIDLKAEIDGNQVDSVSGVSYQLGAGNMLDGLDEALDGLSAGEETTFNSALAAGQRAGEQALVTVNFAAVKERELPPADDDFVELASQFDTIEELRQDLRLTAVKMAERNQVVQAQDKLIDHLLEALDFPAPPGVVQADAESRLERDGKSADDEEALASYKADATKAIRTQLLMDALVEQSKVAASPQELVGFMLRLAGSYGVDPDNFIRTAGESGELPHFQAELLRNKAAAAALRQITVEDEDGQAVDVKSRLSVASDGNDAELGDDLAVRDDDALADEDAALGALIEEVDIDLASLVEAGEES